MSQSGLGQGMTSRGASDDQEKNNHEQLDGYQAETALQHQSTNDQSSAQSIGDPTGMHSREKFRQTDNAKSTDNRKQCTRN